MTVDFAVHRGCSEICFQLQFCILSFCQGTLLSFSNFYMVLLPMLVSFFLLRSQNLIPPDVNLFTSQNLQYSVVRPKIDSWGMLLSNLFILAMLPSYLFGQLRGRRQSRSRYHQSLWCKKCSTLVNKPNASFYCKYHR